MIRTSCIVLLIITVPFVATAGTNTGPKENIFQVVGMDMHHVGMQDHWTAPKEAAQRPNPVPADSASLTRGKKLYESHCQTCHGESGRGDGPAGAAITPKPSNLREMVTIHPAGGLAWKIANGRGPMPAWKEILTESQIWDLVNFIKNFGIDRKRPGDCAGSLRRYLPVFRQFSQRNAHSCCHKFQFRVSHQQCTEAEAG